MGTGVGVDIAMADDLAKRLNVKTNVLRTTDCQRRRRGGDRHQRDPLGNQTEPTVVRVSVGHPFTFEQKAYLIPAGEFATQQWINQRLNIARNDGKYARLCQGYLGQVVGSRP